VLVLPRAVAWAAFAAVAAAAAPLQWLFHHNAVDTVYGSVAAVDADLIVRGLTQLVRLVTELRQRRAELAGLAVAEQRACFSRDLDDSLGAGLSTVLASAPGPPTTAGCTSPFRDPYTTSADANVRAKVFRNGSTPAAGAAKQGWFRRAADMRRNVVALRIGPARAGETAGLLPGFFLASGLRRR
jgi:hypothetical protein